MAAAMSMVTRVVGQFGVGWSPLYEDSCAAEKGRKNWAEVVVAGGDPDEVTRSRGCKKARRVLRPLITCTAQVRSRAIQAIHTHTLQLIS